MSTLGWIALLFRFPRGGLGRAPRSTTPLGFLVLPPNKRLVPYCLALLLGVKRDLCSNPLNPLFWTNLCIQRCLLEPDTPPTVMTKQQASNSAPCVVQPSSPLEWQICALKEKQLWGDIAMAFSERKWREWAGALERNAASRREWVSRLGDSMLLWSSSDNWAAII